MLKHNTRESALRREEFHEVLSAWLDDTFDDVVGDIEGHAGSAWLWVRHEGAHFYLDAASNRAGVRKYMRSVAAAGGDPEWSTLPAEDGVRERIAFGAERATIEGFDFFHHLPAR